MSSLQLKMCIIQYQVHQLPVNRHRYQVSSAFWLRAHFLPRNEIHSELSPEINLLLCVKSSV